MKDVFLTSETIRRWGINAPPPPPPCSAPCLKRGDRRQVAKHQHSHAESGGRGVYPPPSLRTLNFSCIEEETDRRKDTGRSWGTYLNDAQAIYQQG